MSRGYPMGGGGGVDTSMVTATAANVETGKVIVDKDGNPLNGTLRNITTDSVIDHASDNTTPVVLGDEAFISTNSDGQIRAEIRFNGTRGVVEPNTLFAVPQGTMATAGGLTAAKLAQGQDAFGVVGTYKGLGNAGQADVRSGKTFSTAVLSNAPGTMPEQGGSTIMPRSYAQTAVAANRYVTGNVTVAGDANLVAGNIKKGVSIFGTTGTWEGYVANPQDLYYQGANPGGFTADLDSSVMRANFRTDHIYIYPSANPWNIGGWWSLTSTQTYNFTGYTGVKIRLRLNDYSTSELTSNRWFINLYRADSATSTYEKDQITRLEFPVTDIVSPNTPVTLTIPFPAGSHSYTGKLCIGTHAYAFNPNDGHDGNGNEHLFIYQISLY